MARRQLSEIEVHGVVDRPDQVIELRPGRLLAQSICEMGPPGSRKVYLVRVVIDVAEDAIDVVTAYRTSEISRYWRGVQ